VYHPAYSPDLLVGEFIVTLVYNVPASLPSRHGRLHLERSDSSHRYFARPPQHVGWFEPTDSPSSWRADSGWRRIVSSRDPPGVFGWGTSLRIGEHVPDGAGDNFTITAVSDSGFWGWWHEDYGIEMVVDSATNRPVAARGGYFCARRVGQAAA
jgi:hypothetical protein